MYHPTRGGARGGAAEFSWDKVKDSKDREFYLGNSVAAPTGRWQDGRDINWYNKDKNASSTAAADERREELRRIKEAETAALYAKLGRAPPAAAGAEAVVVGDRLASGSSGIGRREATGANSAPLDAGRSRWGLREEEEVSEADKKLARKFAREEVRRRRAAAGEDDGRNETRDAGKDGDRRRHSSRRHDDADEDHKRRHRHHHRHGSSRHKDDDQHDDKESRRHRHHRDRSRSPDSSSRHRRRHRDEDRHRSKGSPSRREHGHESRRLDASPQRHSRSDDDRSSRYRSHRDR